MPGKKKKEGKILGKREGKVKKRLVANSIIAHKREYKGGDHRYYYNS